MKVRTLTALALGTTLITGALFGDTAEAAGRGRYVAPQYTEVQASSAAVHDDHIDLATLNRTIIQWQVARRTLNVWKEREADGALMTLINQEFAENQREMMLAQQEAARSRAELRYSGRQAAQNQGYYGTAAAAQYDLQQAQDDRRDATDKRMEAKAFNRIARQLIAMQPSFDQGRATPAMYQQKAALLRDLRGLAAGELSASKGELMEDQGQVAASGYTAPPPAPYRRR